MRVLFLQSGSAGNCLYIGTTQGAILIDAGISLKKVQSRLVEHGLSSSRIQAVIISHEHSDHIKCAGVYHRQLKLPVWAPCACARKLRQLENFLPNAFKPGDVLTFDGITIETVPTRHDAADPVAFIVDDGRSRLGVFTDLGHPFAGLHERLGTVDALIIESNHDPEMLANGPYPPDLKARIRGDGGHLSNIEAAECVKKWRKQLRWVCLAHLSQVNNTPESACAIYKRIVGSGSPYIAEYYSATPLPPL